MSNHLSASGAPAASGFRTQLVIGAVLVVAVSILTLLFSFLGTITSAALLGMIFGTMKHARWQLVTVAFVFPLVSFAFSQLLTFEKNALLSGLCFAVFWVSYLLTRAGLCLEQKPSTGPRAASGVSKRPRSGAAVGDYPPELRELQGTWVRQAAASEQVAESWEVLGEWVCVRMLGVDQKPQVIFNGRMEVTLFGPYRIGTLSGMTPSERVVSCFGSGRWLYKVMGDNLTIGWHFEANADEPVVATFRRQPVAG